MVLHPHPKRVGVIGCGSGVTVGTVLAGEVEHVDLIEIEPQVVEGAKLFRRQSRFLG